MAMIAWPLGGRVLIWFVAGLLGVIPSLALGAGATAEAASGAGAFPVPLEAYPDDAGRTLVEVLKDRVVFAPFNLVATALFVIAILHTFCTGYFRKLAHRAHHEHEQQQARLREEAARAGRPFQENSVCFRAELFHFLGEIEAIFGLWVLPLCVGIAVTQGMGVAKHYLNYTVNYTEPMFVVVIMTMAATRPVMRLAEQAMARVAALGGGTPGAWWFSILTLGPILGSFITEPAAMTISALLLASKFYEFGPSSRLKYATLGLLFVNISVGGTLTHFAAPPVLMVAGTWGWDLQFMFVHFGWKAVIGLCVSNLVYFAVFRRELAAMAEHARRPVEMESHGSATEWKQTDWPVPAWITGTHLLFMGWTVFTAHYPALFIGGFLFFLAFITATVHHQDDIKLKPALLVGFFLAGLVVHGRLQQWWIEPVLSRLETLPLMIGAIVLTAFNDNAAITYLASLVPSFTPEMKYAVVAGAVTGGGLTVIANAPNPAGQSILQRFFDGGVSPAQLALWALAPTVILGLAFLFLPF